MLNDIEAVRHQAAREAWGQDEEEIIREKVRTSVLMVCGVDHEILAIHEESLGIVCPEGTRHFVVESEHMINGHQCFHISRVYHYRDRCIVLSFKDLLLGKLADVPRKLMEGISDA